MVPAPPEVAKVSKPLNAEAAPSVTWFALASTVSMAFVAALTTCSAVAEAADDALPTFKSPLELNLVNTIFEVFCNSKKSAVAVGVAPALNIATGAIELVLF
jgi:hypothetical protein